MTNLELAEKMVALIKDIQIQKVRYAIHIIKQNPYRLKRLQDAAELARRQTVVV